MCKKKNEEKTASKSNSYKRNGSGAFSVTKNASDLFTACILEMDKGRMNARWKRIEYNS